jgi:hypothetical protein
MKKFIYDYQDEFLKGVADPKALFQDQEIDETHLNFIFNYGTYDFQLILVEPFTSYDFHYYLRELSFDDDNCVDITFNEH